MKIVITTYGQGKAMKRMFGTSDSEYVRTMKFLQSSILKVEGRIANRIEIKRGE